jgi:hypothetical protein
MFLRVIANNIVLELFSVKNKMQAAGQFLITIIPG